MPLKPLKYIAIIFILSFPFHSFSQRSQINKKPQGSKPTIPQESGAENNAPTDKDLEREEERLDESQREIFLQLKKEYKEIINEELNSKIKKNPSQRKHLKKQYSLFFNKTLIDLLRNYRRGKVDIVKMGLFFQFLS
jgi:nicotinamidase-related amidase